MMKNMPVKAKKQPNGKPLLVDGPDYGWKSIREVEHGDSIVVAEQETLVLGVRQLEGGWLVSYSHPSTGVKTEEFYTASDYVSMRLPEQDA